MKQLNRGDNGERTHSLPEIFIKLQRERFVFCLFDTEQIFWWFLIVNFTKLTAINWEIKLTFDCFQLGKLTRTHSSFNPFLDLIIFFNFFFITLRIV